MSAILRSLNHVDKMGGTTEHLRQRLAQIALVEESATRDYGLPYSNIYVTIPPQPGTAYIRWTVEIIDRLDITPAERSAIYEGNALRLLKLPAAA